MKKTKRAVIVQCRLSSSRLPKKAVKELGGKPVLAWVLQSMAKVKCEEYIVATDSESYPVLEPICSQYGYKCFAGDLNNVLKRFCDVITEYNIDTVVRATADNPFLFYEAAQQSLDEFEELNGQNKNVDYLTYTGLPHGSGVEIINGASLLKAFQNTNDPYDTEHVGPALYNHKDLFNCLFISSVKRFNHPELRTTIDTYSDYLRAQNVVNYLNSCNKKAPFTTEEVIDALSNINVKNPIVYMPSVAKGHGTGHLHRCLHAALEGNLNKCYSYVYIPKNAELEETKQVIEQYISQGLNPNQIIDELPDESYAPVLVTDLFKTDSEKLNELRKMSSQLYSIDEGGSLDYSDYLLDIIPSVENERNINTFDSSLISKPNNTRKSNAVLDNILVSIGGEDPAGITEPVIKVLQESLPSAKITAIKKGSSANCGNVSYIEPVPQLREKLYNYDLVITHYGLTAFEAASAGCNVITVSTTKLHEELSKKYGFAYFPYNEITKEKLDLLLKSENLIPKAVVSDEKNSLATKIQTLAAGQRLLCPVCQKQGNVPDQIISRNETRTYRRCNNCSMIYISWTTVPQKNYEKAYFFEDYKKQYGKTYEEDFESIKKSCLKRVDCINKVRKTSGNRTLDIGCAYGPFLSAAYDKGLDSYGTDISSDAVEYVKNKLHFPACCSSFPNIDAEKEFGINKFDIVTMWYVIEHFKNLDEILKKVNELLKIDGIFAFSTPSGSGISAKSDKNHFFQISPMDHYSVWEPEKADKILRKFGFKVVKTVSTGHHPERFPIVKEKNIQKGSAAWKRIDRKSHYKRLGDTVEIYCRKISEIKQD